MELQVDIPVAKQPTRQPRSEPIKSRAWLCVPARRRQRSITNGDQYLAMRHCRGQGTIVV